MPPPWTRSGTAIATGQRQCDKMRIAGYQALGEAATRCPGRAGGRRRRHASSTRQERPFLFVVTVGNPKVSSDALRAHPLDHLPAPAGRRDRACQGTVARPDRSLQKNVLYRHVVVVPKVMANSGVVEPSGTWPARTSSNPSMTASSLGFSRAGACCRPLRADLPGFVPAPPPPRRRDAPTPPSPSPHPPLSLVAASPMDRNRRPALSCA